MNSGSVSIFDQANVQYVRKVLRPVRVDNVTVDGFYSYFKLLRKYFHYDPELSYFLARVLNFSHTNLKRCKLSYCLVALVDGHMNLCHKCLYDVFFISYHNFLCVGAGWVITQILFLSTAFTAPKLDHQNSLFASLESFFTTLLKSLHSFSGKQNLCLVTCECGTIDSNLQHCSDHRGQTNGPPLEAMCSTCLLRCYCKLLNFIAGLYSHCCNYICPDQVMSCLKVLVGHAKALRNAYSVAYSNLSPPSSNGIRYFIETIIRATMNALAYVVLHKSNSIFSLNQSRVWRDSDVDLRHAIISLLSYDPRNTVAYAGTTGGEDTAPLDAHSDDSMTANPSLLHMVHPILISALAVGLLPALDILVPPFITKILYGYNCREEGNTSARFTPGLPVHPYGRPWTPCNGSPCTVGYVSALWDLDLFALSRLFPELENMLGPHVFRLPFGGTLRTALPTAHIKKMCAPLLAQSITQFGPAEVRVLLAVHEQTYRAISQARSICRWRGIPGHRAAAGRAGRYGQSGSILPDEVWLQVFSFISAKRVCRLATCNRRLRRLSHDPVLWEYLYFKTWAKSHEDPVPGPARNHSPRPAGPASQSSRRAAWMHTLGTSTDREHCLGFIACLDRDGLSDDKVDWKEQYRVRWSVLDFTTRLHHNCRPLVPPHGIFRCD